MLASSSDKMNIIQEIFSGEISNTAICEICKTEETNKEVLFDLSLPIAFPELETYDGYLRNQERAESFYRKFLNFFSKANKSSVGLTECLKMYFGTVVVKEDFSNLRQCDKCNQKAPFTRKSNISRAPKHLLIVLKRYGDNKKYKVNVPLELDLGDFCSENIGSKKYSLYAVISHVGLSGLGHYKCYCKNHTDSKWYCFNDTKIIEVTIEKLLSIQVYIAFYELIEADYSFIIS